MADLTNQVKSVIDILREAHNKVSFTAIDAELLPMRTRVLAGIGNEISLLSIQVGENPVLEKDRTLTSRPLKSIFGVKVNQSPAETFEKNPGYLAEVDEGKPAPVVEVPDLQQQGLLEGIQTQKSIPPKPEYFGSREDQELSELQKRSDELYGNFLTIDSSSIVDSYSDLEIRATAQLAGLPVTEKSPAKADVKFVDQIKEAITKKNALSQVIDPATSHVENEGTNDPNDPENYLNDEVHTVYSDDDVHNDIDNQLSGDKDLDADNSASNEATSTKGKSKGSKDKPAKS